jgi:ribonuclease P protein component
MLARKYSLKSTDINLIKSKGRTISSDNFVLLYHKRFDENPPRFAFIVSTKVSKNASLRNRAKRAMSEGARRAVFNLKPGLDFVFIAKPSIIKKYTKDVMSEVDTFLLKKFSK